MSKQTCSDNTVVHISDMRKIAEKKAHEESMNKYLSILSFSQLINETSNAIELLDQSNFSEETAIKSQLVLKELGKRIEHQANKTQFKDQNSVLKEMKNKIDQRFQSLRPYL